MKLLVLAALVALATGRHNLVDQYDNQPWQTGKVYYYKVLTDTLARLEEGASTGSVFRALFTIRARAPGRLQARLEQSQHAQIHQQLPNTWTLPDDLKFEDVENLNQIFEIYLEGGRVVALKLPSSLSLQNENLIKGLISALQVDLSAYRNIQSAHDNFDKETMQGLYRKMENDVTGDCETLYSVSPISSEWRQELPYFAVANDREPPFVVTKSRDYKHCHHRVAYHFGVPEYAQWTGVAENPKEEQFMQRKTVSRILVGKQGPIYKAETTSTVHVSPQLYGKQKAEVRSNVKLILNTYSDDEEAEWQMSEAVREIPNLLYALNSKQVIVKDVLEQKSSESHEHELHYQYPQNQASEQEEDTNKRVRRSLNHQKYVTINKVIIKRSDENQSSDSDSTSAYVNDDVPQINEPAYSSLYMSPQPRVDKKQNPMNAQKLVQEIAQLLQNPNNMPKNDFLSKFNILVRLIASMSSDQLSQTSRSIEVGKSSNNNVKADMWMIYRDAVAQAGTLPAFQQIKSWIVSKKIEGEEAAQIISSLPQTLRYPTKEVMMQFFNLAMSPEVKEQKYLNTTVLISATRFIHKAQVNNETAHTYYPTHMYGRLANKHDKFVLEDVLPRLSKELERAIENGDNHKAQVYIRAIGNLGHRAILDVYAPYLEGKVKVSTYLRAQMVNNLEYLAHSKDHYARAVLYSILRNVAEPYEVRIMAIRNVFMTRPTGVMMQAMAEMTQKDPSMHVRAALKASIESAAKLKNPRYWDLARTAEAAKPSLTKDDFGSLNWGKKFFEFFDQEYDRSLMSVMSFDSSAESLFPNYMKYSWRSKADGYQRMNTIATTFSSYRQFIDLLLQKLTMQKPVTHLSPTEHQYSAEKIADMLNIKRDAQDPLQASFFIDFMNQQRYFSLTKDDMDRLPAFLKEYMDKLAKGVDMHYTKVLNQAQVSIMFPLASGMPFIYKYKEPTVIHIQAKAKAEVNIPSAQNPEYSMMSEKEIQFTYARNIEGSVGFLNTLANQFASAGVVSKYQLNVPVKVQTQFKHGQLKIRLEPLKPEQDTSIAYYSVWPYTANQKKDTLTPVSLDPTTKVITRNNKVVSVDSKFGQNTGIQFQIQGYSYSKDYRNFGSMLQGQDLLSNILFALSQRDVAMTHFNFKYLGKQSQNKAIAITAVYDTLYNQKQPEAPVVATEIQDVTPHSEARFKEIVKRAVSGIQSARAQIIDLSATFEGSQKAEYIFTAAVGDSKVDQKIQYAFFASRNSVKAGNTQFNSVGRLNKPDVSALNFVEALKKELKTSFEADFHLGQNNGNIQIKGQAERTDKGTQELQKHPWAKQAMQEFKSNNHYQEASKMMIIMAHAPTHMKVLVSYKDLSPAFINMTYKAYKALTTYGYWYSDINPLKTAPQGKLEIEAEASFLDHYVNWDMISRYGHLKMNNVPIPKFSAEALSLYSPMSVFERVLNQFTRQQYLPTCTVDGTMIRTFSDRSYDHVMSSTWQVVVHDDAKYAGPWDARREQLVVLARRFVEDQQQHLEVYISYKSDTGKDMEIEMKPTAAEPVKITTNAKKVSEGQLTMYWDDIRDAPLLQYYVPSKSVVILEIGQDRLRAIYDGQRIVILAKDNRNNIRGLCGYMSGEPRDDYLTQYGLVYRPDLYAAAYTLNHDSSDPTVQKLLQLLKDQAHQPQYVYTSILRADHQWRQEMRNSHEDDWIHQIVYRARSFVKEQDPSQKVQQIQYFENQSEICISTSRVYACQKHSKGLNYQIQPVQVVCRPKLDQQFQTFRNQIQKGGNPVVSGKEQTVQYRVPSSCQA